MSKVVKNLTDQDLTLPNIGIAKAGETIKVPDDFHNGNFEEVKPSSPPGATVATTKKDEVGNKKDEKKLAGKVASLSGEQLFKDRCSPCHNGPSKAAAYTELRKLLNDDDGMPKGRERLSDEQINTLIDWIKGAK